MNIALLASVSLAVLSIVFNIAGLASSDWLSGRGITCGLWQCCANGACVSSGKALINSGSQLNTAKALLILGAFSGIGGLVVQCVALFVTERKKFYLAAGGLYGVAGFFLLVGASQFRSQPNSDSVSWDWGFGISVTGGVFYLFAAIGAVGALAFDDKSQARPFPV